MYTGLLHIFLHMNFVITGKRYLYVLVLTAFVCIFMLNDIQMFRRNFYLSSSKERTLSLETVIYKSYFLNGAEKPHVSLRDNKLSLLAFY